MALSLEKYKGKSTRHDCPACGHKHQFARYVDDRGEYIADNVGRCNRESKCGYHYPPAQYFKDHPESRPAGVEPRLARPAPKPRTVKPFDTIDPDVLRESLTGYDRNAFVQFLLSRFDEQSVLDAAARYLIGFHRGYTVFWQVDQAKRIRTGKMIAYDPDTGRRRKDIYPTWVHSELQKQRRSSGEFELRQCLFGEHLLSTDQGSPVAIVESEKTAVIASLCLPRFIWLASGGKQSLGTAKLAKLKDRKIILFPDADAVTQWQKIAIDARSAGLDVQASDLFETYSTDDERAEGFDIADYLLIEMSERQNVSQESMCDQCGQPDHREQGEGWVHVWCSSCRSDRWERAPGRRWIKLDSPISGIFRNAAGRKMSLCVPFEQ